MNQICLINKITNAYVKTIHQEEKGSNVSPLLPVNESPLFQMNFTQSFGIISYHLAY